MDYSSIANLPNMGPGSTGTDVEKLQQWLVDNHFMTDAQMRTGVGVYGPLTKAAVAQWQQSDPKLAAAAGVNAGYFGPLSKTYIQQQTTAAKAPTGTSSAAPAAVTPAYAMVSAGVDQANQKASLGAPVRDFSQAMAEATKNPDIVAKYGDMAKLDAQSFSQALDQLRQSSSTEQQMQQTQFEDERKKLAEAAGASGTAYSGFRGRAQKELAQSESGIVQSSRSQLQKNLQDLTTQFESKYGTGSATPATASFTDPNAASKVGISGLATSGAGGSTTLSGTLAGGITGTQTLAKQADISSDAYKRYTADNPAPM